MKKIILIFAIAAFGLTSCETKYDIIDTGVANGRFNGNMYEYLKSNSYDWDSLRLMIDQAGLVDLFEGTRPGYERITFFGPTNHSIRRWMLQNSYATVSAIPVAQCQTFVWQHVVKGKFMKDDFPEGQIISSWPMTVEGGITHTAENGNTFWICTVFDSYAGILGAGAKYIKIVGSANATIDVASANIEPDNGVVHSLNYNYELGKL